MNIILTKKELEDMINYIKLYNLPAAVLQIDEYGNYMSVVDFNKITNISLDLNNGVNNGSEFN